MNYGRCWPAPTCWPPTRRGARWRGRSGEPGRGPGRCRGTVRSVTPGAWRGRLPAPGAQPEGGPLTSTPQPDTTAHPAPAELTGQELEETIKLAHEWGALKQLPRTGWTRAGSQQPESVAAHTARTAMLAWIIAGLERANQDRAATLALFHDSQESRTGDLDHVGRNSLQPVR